MIKKPSHATVPSKYLWFLENIENENLAYLGPLIGREPYSLHFTIQTTCTNTAVNLCSLLEEYK